MVGDSDNSSGYSGGSNRAKADQCLKTSEKLLASSDFEGAKNFAIRACKADPSRAHASDYILAITDTLLGGGTTVGDFKIPDWYSILRVVRLTQNLEHVAVQYRRLALLLNPTVNRLPFADQALKLVTDAWCVLSDPFKKSVYDQELEISQSGTQAEQFQLGRLERQTESFWTACPYCYMLFEYPKGYEECILRCENCRRAVEAVETQTPPEDGNGEGVYFCSWGMFCLGYSDQAKGSSWSPISPFDYPVQRSDQEANLNATTRNGDELYVTISDDDDDMYVAISDDGKRSKKG